MAKFLMLGKYSQEAIQGITAERTEKIVKIIQDAGGKVNLMYVLLGSYDLFFVVDFPGIPQAIKASVSLAKSTGISFTTSPAITAEEFDALLK